MNTASRNKVSIFRRLCQFIFLVAILSVLACGGSAPAPASTAAIGPTTAVVETPLPVTVPPAVTAVTPVKYSLITTTLEQPLASGISVPEIVDQVLPSIVEIRTGTGGGTGFVLTSAGLIVTNKHVMAGSSTARLRFTSGQQYDATVTKVHPTLDLAYLAIRPAGIFQPIQAGDSNQARVGEQVVIVGFPIGAMLGAEPTVSMGIISAKRDGMLQTDAPLNPGNSGGPMLDAYGNVIGIIKSRIDESQGATIAGIGFAIPINNVDIANPAQVDPTSLPAVLVPTARPASTSPPMILAPTIDVAATKEAIDTRIAIAQTKVAHDLEMERQKQETAAYAARAVATAMALVPTPTPRPTSTPTPPPTATPIPPTRTPSPTATPHPQVYCETWEKMVLEWIYQGNSYPRTLYKEHLQYLPVHPMIAPEVAHKHCVKKFPDGLFPTSRSGTGIRVIAYGAGELLPGLYKYQERSGSERKTVQLVCRSVNINLGSLLREDIEIVYGEPFEFRFLPEHGKVGFGGMGCPAFLYRIGD